MSPPNSDNASISKHVYDCNASTPISILGYDELSMIYKDKNGKEKTEQCTEIEITEKHLEI